MKEIKKPYKNIKSAYILKEIFSYIEKRQSLYIIYGDKSIMKKLEITLDDYKKVSGKIIKKEQNLMNFWGEKEDNVYFQDTNIKVFKGNYIKGKKNGKGKEYYINKKKKFEGEYSNGKKIKGTGYDKFGNIIYKIENGKVIEKYKNGNLVFEGKYFNGKKYTGIGYDIYGNKAYEIKYGKGHVKEFFDDGVLKFEGEYFNGERNGKGIRYDYEGEILFEGIYLNGEKWTGKGKEYYTDHDDEDDTDENPFKNMTFNVGKKKKKKSELGFFLGDLGNKNLTRITLNNFGLPQAKKVLKFEGEYLNGLRHGKGKEYNKDEQLIYEGDYLYGKWDGQGKQYYSSYLGKEQLLYEGEFKDGQWDGVGKQYKTGITPGGIEKEGIFEKGKFIEYMKVD